MIAQQGREGPRIMIDAHMDELGGPVRRVTPEGLLSMQMLGGYQTVEPVVAPLARLDAQAVAALRDFTP